MRPRLVGFVQATYLDRPTIASPIEARRWRRTPLDRATFRDLRSGFNATNQVASEVTTTLLCRGRGRCVHSVPLVSIPPEFFEHASAVGNDPGRGVTIALATGCHVLKSTGRAWRWSEGTSGSSVSDDPLEIHWTVLLKFRL